MIGKDIKKAAEIIKSEGIVAVPTETVYGLAANALSKKAVSKVFAAKGRPSHNPLIIHLADTDDLPIYCREIPPKSRLLLEAFSPGPLTLVLPKTDFVPEMVTGGMTNVAVRIPAHPMMLELIRECGFPLAAPSANPSGFISPTSPMHVLKGMSGKIDYILDGGNCEAGLESTIIGFYDGIPVVLREGVISRGEIEKLIGKVRTLSNDKILSPGMMSSHYCPRTPLLLSENIVDAIGKLPKMKIGLITYGGIYKGLPEDCQISLCQNEEFSIAARNLYAAMHELDERGYDLIIARRFPDHGIGVAINDRLFRASIKL